MDDNRELSDVSDTPLQPLDSGPASRVSAMSFGEVELHVVPQVAAVIEAPLPQLGVDARQAHPADQNHPLVSMPCAFVWPTLSCAQLTERMF